jgi:predicted NBD/HSP70 family sugar kinase
MYKSSQVSPEILASVLYDLRNRPMTATQLQEITKLSEVTIRRAIKDLQKRHLVISVGQQPSRGGRPPTVYSLNGRVKLVVGIHLELPSLHLVVTDLSGNVVRGPHHVLNYQFTPQEAIREIDDFIHQTETDVGDGRLIGVGLALPGYFDPSGVMLSVEREPTWSNVPLTPRLRRELGLSILPANDVDSMAQAEIDLDPSIAEMDFVYLGFTKGGTKASLFLDGELYSGPFGNAGNIGHTVVDPGGRMCRCGNRGCLEAVASVRAVGEAFDEQLVASGYTKGLAAGIEQTADPREKFKAILEAAEAGDPLCERVVHQALDFLGLALGNLINLFQVRLVILGGALGDIPPGLRTKLDDSTRQTITPLLRNYLMTLRRAQNKRRCNAALGAASLYVEHYLREVIQRELV